MFSLSWLLERGVTRGRPMTRRAIRTLAMGTMIVAGLLQTGCQSGPCGRVFGPCGFAARATSKLVVQPARRVASVFGHGPEYVYDAPMEYAEPIGVVAPVVPFGSPAPGPILEGAPVPSTVAPANGDAPTSLEPLPSAEPGPGPSSRDSGVRQPSSHDARRPATNPNRGENLAHTLVSTPDAAAVSTHEAAKPLSRTAATTDIDGILDDLPPLDLPAELTERNDTPPVAPAAVKPKPKAEAESASLDSASVSAPAPADDDHSPGGRSARAQAESDIHPPPAPEIEPAPSDPLGISRFVAVDLKLAGGSAPSTVGLGWLADKGYKTLLDLRNTSEFDASFIGEAAKRGLRYVAFPTDFEKLDREHIERFSTELALNDARPLYFFDDDGSRAGALWFIRRVVADKVAWDIARREAEEIGLTSGDNWREVHEAVDRQLALAAPAAAPRSTSKDADAEVKPSAKADAEVNEPPVEPAKSAPAPQPAPAKPTARAEPADADRVSSVFEIIQTSSENLPDAWRPAAALVLTSLSFPLAYFGRSVIPVILAKTRASLPGPGPQPKSLPSSSDA